VHEHQLEGCVFEDVHVVERVHLIEHALAIKFKGVVPTPLPRLVHNSSIVRDLLVTDLRKPWVLYSTDQPLRSTEVEVLGIVVDDFDAEHRFGNCEGVCEVQKVNASSEKHGVNHGPSDFEGMSDLKLSVRVSFHDDVGDINIVRLMGIDICSTDDLK